MFMLARAVSRRRKVQIANFLAIRTPRRMFSYREFPRALGRSEALVTRMRYKAEILVALSPNEEADDISTATTTSEHHAGD